MFPKENPYLYIEEFKNNYYLNENKMKELKYKLLDEIVNNSKFLRGIQENNMIAFIRDISINGENIDISLLFKLYEGIFDLNEKEVYKLIEYLDYLNSDKLLDILTYAIYKNIDLTNYCNRLKNQSKEFHFTDNLTKLENFNRSIIKNEGNFLEDKSYLIFIIENQVSLAKYFFWDFYNKDNIFYIFKTIFKYSNDNTLLLWIMDELNIKLDFDFLLRSLVFNKFFFDKVNISLNKYYSNTNIIDEIFREGSLDSIKFLYKNYFDFINHSITRIFEDILYDKIYDNNNSIEILTWIKEKYPTELYEFFVYSDYFENIFSVFRKHNKNTSYYLDFIIWIIDNYPIIIIDYIEIILNDILSSNDNIKVKYIVSRFRQ